MFFEDPPAPPESPPDPDRLADPDASPADVNGAKTT